MNFNIIRTKDTSSTLFFLESSNFPVFFVLESLKVLPFNMIFSQKGLISYFFSM